MVAGRGRCFLSRLPVSPGCHAHIFCTIACPGIALQLSRSYVGLMLVGGRLDRCLFNLVVKELWANGRISGVCRPASTPIAVPGRFLPLVRSTLSKVLRKCKSFFFTDMQKNIDMH